MIPLLVVLHVIASLTLILFILLHAGRGGGLSDMFGGGMNTSLGGSTVVERNLDRLTVGAAIMFGLTSVLLALMLAPQAGQ
jgi:preprotein translocase subunit SecG